MPPAKSTLRTSIDFEVMHELEELWHKSGKEHFSTWFNEWLKRKLLERSGA